MAIRPQNSLTKTVYPHYFGAMDRKIEKKRWTLKNIIGFSSIGTFSVFILYSFIFMDMSSKLNVDTKRITISPVQRGLFQEFIPVRGRFLPIETIYLDATEGGRVKEIFLEAGTFVNKGDKILQLENTNLILDIMYREAQLFEQSNNLRNTRLSMEQHRLTVKGQLIQIDYDIQRLKRLNARKKELMEKNLISKQEYEEVLDEYEYALNRRELAIESFKQDSIFRETQIGQLESSLARMQANLDIMKQKQENQVIRAPITGLLSALNAEIGESKSPGQRLGQIDVLDNFKVRADIDEHYITRIERGLKGEFDLAGTTYRLVITKIYPEVVDGRFEIDMEYEGNSPKDVKRGQTMQIRLALGDLTEAVLLPRGGFYQKTGGNWVFVLNPSGVSAEKRRIKLGRQNPLNFEVIEGLEPGEQVVTSTYDNFGDADILLLNK